MLPSLEKLKALQRSDGGFGPSPDATSEPESTALSAIALDDERARIWLAMEQWPDGSFGIRAGEVVRDTTAQVALALPDGEARDRALDHLETVYASNGGSSSRDDPRGWPWTDGAHGWVEPTAWGLLALRSLRASATERIDDALRMLHERECVGGGWNFGTRSVFGVNLEPYVQTTALALLAIVGLDDDLTKRGLTTLHHRWRSESSGVLSLALTAAAFGVYEHPEAPATATMLSQMAGTSRAADTVALAWAGIALGPGIERLDLS